MKVIFQPLMQFLKGQSNEIFDLQFSSSLEPTYATDQQVEIFSILVRLDPGEIDSPGYKTPGGHVLTDFRLLPARISPQGVWFFNLTHLNISANS